jgi:hypothetical protein
VNPDPDTVTTVPPPVGPDNRTRALTQVLADHLAALREDLS